MASHLAHQVAVENSVVGPGVKAWSPKRASVTVFCVATPHGINDGAGDLTTVTWIHMEEVPVYIHKTYTSLKKLAAFSPSA